MVLVTPDSSAIICCVRRAIVAASSVGNARTSSSELVWSDCVPPRTAARASRAVLITLLYGCWAVREQPAVCVWNLSHNERWSFALNLSVMIFAHILLAALYFAISSKKSRWELKKNESRGAKESTARPLSRAAST